MAPDPREAFVEGVKAIDPIFKRGDLGAFWPKLRALMAVAPDRADVSKKKSHYLASLAARCLARNDPAAALRFLEYAEAMVDGSHLTPFLLRERADFRRQAEDSIRSASCPREPSGVIGP